MSHPSLPAGSPIRTTTSPEPERPEAQNDNAAARPGQQADRRPLQILRGVIRDHVRSERPDLSVRQLAVLLTVYLEDEHQTVRGLAAALNVSKPAITRALDRLGEMDLARRKTDPMDRRSVLVQRTLKGAALLRQLHTSFDRAEAEVTA